MELDPRFKIRAPLRCEGIGRLDCAEDLESGMRMAVRWLPLDANGSAAVQACEQLPEHHTLPRIRQIGQVGTSAFVAMDFPDGNLLATQLHEALPAAALIGITAQLADALASIHGQDTFHGEMSADSVLLVKAPSEKAYLWDMPLVIANRITDRRGEDRLMHQLVKNAPFLSPERARGAKPSAESDVYSLGAVVCIAGGASLPQCDTTLGVVHSIATGAWLPMVPKSLPEPLRSMLERMVLADPKSRPTAREVAELFMPPVAAHRTEPELAAIVLPEPVVVASSPVLVPIPVLIAAAPGPAPTAPMPYIPAMHPAHGIKVDAAIAAVIAESKVQTSVALTDNLSVSQELSNDGAALLSPGEAAALGRPNRKVPLIVAAVMAALVVVLGGLAINLASNTSSAVELPLPASAQQQAEQAKGATKVSSGVAESDDDELSALTPRAKRPAAKKKVARVEAVASDTAAAPPAIEPTKENDFGFLEPEQDLKRPSF